MAVNPDEIQKIVNAEVRKLVVALSEAKAARHEACLQKSRAVGMEDFQESRANRYQKILLKLMEKSEKGRNLVRINVQFSGRDWKTFDIWVNPDDTVGIVKAIVEYASGVPVRLQRLFYLEKECDDDEVLQDFFEGGELRTVFKQNSR